MTVKNRANEQPKFKPRGTPFRFRPIRKGDIHERTGRVCIGLDEAGDPRWGRVLPNAPRRAKTNV